MRKHKGRVITLIIVITVILSAVILWVTGPIPSLIARVSADRYVESRYSDLRLKFSEIWTLYDTYFVSYTDEAGEVYNFKMSECIPNTVMYDPINPPG